MQGNGRDLFNQYGGIISSGRKIWILDDVLRGGVKRRHTQTSINVNGSVSYKLLPELTISNKTGINYKNNGAISIEHQMDTCL